MAFNSRISRSAAGHRIGVVVSRFNAEVTEKLLESAVSALREQGAREEDLLVINVPGAWEIPFGARELIRSAKVDAVVALGAVIRGETAHFEYVSGEAIRGIAELQRETGVPISLGILTTEDEAQAVARIDKGAEAALAAVEMANLRLGLHPRSPLRKRGSR